MDNVSLAPHEDTGLVTGVGSSNLCCRSRYVSVCLSQSVSVCLSRSVSLSVSFGQNTRSHERTHDVPQGLRNRHRERSLPNLYIFFLKQHTSFQKRSAPPPKLKLIQRTNPAAILRLVRKPTQRLSTFGAGGLVQGPRDV